MPMWSWLNINNLSDAYYFKTFVMDEWEGRLYVIIPLS